MPAPFIHLLLTLRGPVWRVRGRGLAKDKPEEKANEGKKGDHHDCISHFHDSPLRVRWECWGMLEAIESGLSSWRGMPRSRSYKRADWTPVFQLAPILLVESLVGGPEP